MQLLAKLEKILYMGFRATLNFRKIYGGSEPHVQNFFQTLPKVASYPAFQTSILRKYFTALFLKYKRLR